MKAKKYAEALAKLKEVRGDARQDRRMTQYLVE